MQKGVKWIESTFSMSEKEDTLGRVMLQKSKFKTKQNKTKQLPKKVLTKPVVYPGHKHKKMS